MAVPASRDQLKDFCLRQLGFPVIQINVDDDQVEDCIDLALQYFQDFHSDGIEKGYFKHLLTTQNFTDQYIPITNDGVIGVTRIFPLSTSNSTVNMFDLRYQLRLHELYDFTSTSYVNYALTMQHLRTLDMLFSGEQPIRFNRHTNKLYIDWNWAMYSAGEYVIIEQFYSADPNTYPRVYNDRMLKRLATAYIKKMWGNNMKKFGGMQLPGGITMNGQQIYEEAVTEVKEVEDLIVSTHQFPAQFLVG